MLIVTTLVLHKLKILLSHTGLASHFLFMVPATNIAGASSGIGAETARVLALRGVRVIMAVRNTSAGKEVKEAIANDAPAAKVAVMELDLSSLASVKKFASEFVSFGIPLNLLM